MSDDAPQDRTLTWWPIAGAAAVAAVGVAAIIGFGSGTNNRQGLETDSSTGALTCPDTYLQQAITGTPPRAWVPTKSVGVDGTKALVPDTKPQHVTVCHYIAGTALDKTEKLPLSGTRIVKTGVGEMAKSLSKAPAADVAVRTCSGPADTYLAGFVIPTGAVWVTVPDNNCQDVTNGEFDTGEDIRPQIVTAYETGAWH